MSRAFVKEDAQGPDEDPPERPLSTQPNYCTPAGIRWYHDAEAAILKELEGYAGAQADPVRKKEKRVLERDLRWVRARLEAAIPVDPVNQPKDQVRFGATVTLRGAGGVRKVVIVGEDEADEEGVKISWASPFAQALYGLKAGQDFEWGEGENSRFTVEKLEYN